MSGDTVKDWWAPLRIGLFTDKKHRERMGPAIWLYGYLHLYANRQTGRLTRNCGTIASEIGAEVKTVQRWMRLLEKEKYIQLRRLPHGFSIQIEKFRPINKEKGTDKNVQSPEERSDIIEAVIGQFGDSDWTFRDSSDKNGVHETTGKENPKDTRLDKNEGLKESIKESIKDIYRVFNFWNAQKIIRHREFEKFLPAIKARLNHYSPEEIIRAIGVYKKVLDSPDHYFTHRWTLSDFISRKNGIDQFLDEDAAMQNFAKKNNVNGYRSQADINSASTEQVVT